MKIELVVERDDIGMNAGKRSRFVIDLNELGEARIRHASDPHVERDDSQCMTISNGSGGYIALVLTVEAKP